MKRTGKKALSLLLTLCMVVSLFAGLTLPAAATADDSWVGTTTFDYTANKTGDGWNWDATSKTLTLFGVNVTGSVKDAIYINGEAKIVLEGANKATGTSGIAAVHIEDNSKLTIEGSGTLEAIDGSVGIQAGTLTINSGYITATGLGTGIKVRAVTVNGGYVLATGGSEGIQAYGTDDAVKYEQTGGYVKAVATGAISYAIQAGDIDNKPVTISGGYLEAEAVTAGIHCGAFSNNGGVVKVNTGAENGIKASTATFSGGVTIAKGTTAAFSAEPTYSNSEALKLGDIYNAADTEVIIAKNYYTRARTDLSALDGVYIKYSGTEPAITAAANITVSGGSYIEAASNYALDASNYNATINGTLVCLNTANNKSAISVDYSRTITVAEQGTLYCNGSGSMGLSNPGIIYNSGQLITEGSKAGVAADTINCNDGYIFGLGASELYGGVTASTKLNVVNGYITGIGNSNGIGVSSNGTTAFTDNNHETKAMTAICASNKSYASTNIASKGVVVTGTAMKYDPLEPATFSSYNETYMVDTSKAMVVCAKVASGPSAAISGSAIAANTGMAFTGDVTVTLTNAKFAAIDKDADVSAWFAFPDGWTATSAKVKTAVAANATTATVTIGGKINNAGSASLTGGSIPTTAFAEATDAAVVPTGSVTVNITDYSGTLYLKAGVLYTNSACTAAYTGQTDNWSTTGGELYLNGFEYTSTADTALDIVGDDTVIHVSGTNSFTTAKMVAVNRDKSGMLSIVGDGTLNATTTGSTSGNRYGFYNQGGLTVGSGVTLNCVGGDSTGGNSDGLVIGGRDLTTSLIIEAGATVYAKAGTAKNDPNKFSSGSRLDAKAVTINGSFYATGNTYAIYSAQGFSLNPGEGVIVKASTEYNIAAPATAYAPADIAAYKTVKAYVPSAKAADVTVTGYTGEELAEAVDVTITLEGYKFANEIAADTDVATWFATDNLPAGLTAKIKTTVAANATSATIKIEGTPTAISSAAMSIVIPGASLGETDPVTVTANANAKFNITAAPDSWVGTEGFFYAEDAAGDSGNWSWSASKKTLTLSGVNVSRSGKQGIFIAGDATIVLEGANKATANTNNKAALDCSGSLTIKGSGTLEASSTNGNGVNIGKTLTVKSGYITVSGGVCGISTDGAVTVDGGYIVASATGNGSGISIAHASFEMNGGYVKTSGAGQGTSGLYARTNVTIKGGYIEATGVVGGIETYTGIFTNGGGVVKATGTTNGIKVTTARFTGGVTIATGSTKAIDGATVTGTEDRLEKVWTLTSGVASAETAIGTSIAGTSVVIAKAVTAPQKDANGLITLDGVYLYSSTAAALDTEHEEAYYDVAVTGGSYLETTGNKPVITTDPFNPTHALTITGTLVCEGASAGMLVTADTVKVAEDATLYVSNNGLALNAKTSIENSGNLIGESTTSHGIGMVIQQIPAPAINVTGGYLCGVSAATNGGCIEADSLTATGGYITGVGGYHCIKVTTSASITGDAVITASTSGHGYSGPEIASGTEKATVKGAIAQYTALAATQYAGDPAYTYNGVDSTAAKVLLIKGTTAPPPPPVPATDVFYVIVDGRSESIGELETDGGDKLVKVDSDKLGEKLKAAKDGSDVIVNVPAATGKASAELVVKDVNDMAEKGMELKVRSGGVEYAIPADAVDTEALIKELGAADPALVSFGVSFGEVPADSVILGKGTLVAMPIEFTVTATFGGKAVEVEVFEKYTSRTVEVSAADAANITTAVVLEGDAQRHAPTNVYQKNGQWYARISTLTNSVYALIDYDAGFADAKGLWYEAVVSEMASREIIDGRDADTFDGEADITRAEFAALVVRALGLPSDGDASMFKDVAKGAWYYGAVGKAYEYKLLEGRGDGVFDPLAKITRQEAMQMVYNAAKLAEIKLLSGINPGQYTDLDKVSGWAEDAVSFNLLNGLVKGDGGLIRPTDNISRAESATILLRLLQKSELVDARAEA